MKELNVLIYALQLQIYMLILKQIIVLQDANLALVTLMLIQQIENVNLHALHYFNIIIGV